MNARLLLTAIFLWAMFAVRGQDMPAPAGADTLVSFVTVYPGSEIYELEGHSALRVRLGSGPDYAVNFGLFDFNAPHFVYRFVKGETDYMVGAYPWRLFVESYAGTGRRIVEQPLNLSPEATRRLLSALSAQLTPPDNVYRYNYVLDNCATRPLGFVLLAAEADSVELSAPTPERLGHTTFREIMRYYHRNYPWYQFGIDLALGPLIDRPVSRMEQTFAPVSLEEALAGSSLAGEAREVTEGAPGGAACGPTPWLLSPMAFALAVFLASLGVTVRDFRTGRLSRGFDAALFGTYGIAGCVVTFLVFVSEHYAANPNYIIWWLNPLCFIPVIFLWTKSTRRIVFWYQIINFAVLIGLIFAWPFCGQSANPAIWPLIAAEILRSGRAIAGLRNNGTHTHNCTPRTNRQ